MQYPSGITGWPATLNPGQQVVLSITFSPDAAASFNGNLALTSDASGGTANVPLSGTGDAVPAADLTLSTTSINFGQVQIGSKVTRSLTLTSTGNAPLTISAITVAGAQFSDGSPSLPVTLQPQQQLTLTLTYQPTTEGSDSGTLTVASNDSSGPATVSLGGSGTTAASPQLTVNPTAVDFGSVPLNTPGNKTVTLTSSGTAAVTITAANVTGSSFSVSGASFPLTLNPNQTVTLQVQFDPSAAGTASGQLSITSDATGGTAMIPLSGTGAVTTSAQLTVSTNSLSFGNVAVNSTATLSRHADLVRHGAGDHQRRGSQRGFVHGFGRDFPGNVESDSVGDLERAVQTDRDRAGGRTVNDHQQFVDWREQRGTAQRHRNNDGNRAIAGRRDVAGIWERSGEFHGNASLDTDVFRHGTGDGKLGSAQRYRLQRFRSEHPGDAESGPVCHAECAVRPDHCRCSDRAIDDQQ